MKADPALDAAQVEPDGLSQLEGVVIAASAALAEALREIPGRAALRPEERQELEQAYHRAERTVRTVHERRLAQAKRAPR